MVFLFSSATSLDGIIFSLMELSHLSLSSLVLAARMCVRYRVLSSNVLPKLTMDESVAE